MLSKDTKKYRRLVYKYINLKKEQEYYEKKIGESEAELIKEKLLLDSLDNVPDFVQRWYGNTVSMINLGMGCNKSFLEGVIKKLEPIKNEILSNYDTDLDRLLELNKDKKSYEISENTVIVI